MCLSLLPNPVQPLSRQRNAPIRPVSSPSITTRPASGSTIRKSVSSSVDLPEPVRPQMPTCTCVTCVVCVCTCISSPVADALSNGKTYNHARTRLGAWGHVEGQLLQDGIQVATVADHQSFHRHFAL